MSAKRKSKNRRVKASPRSKPNANAVAPVAAGIRSARPNSDVWRAVAPIRPETTLRALNARDRASIRTQARAEFWDNPHASGIVRLFTLYVVGTGPRLRFRGADRYLACF